MKKLIIVPALLTAIGGGFLLAQADFLQGNAEEQNMIKAAEAKQIALELYGGKIVSFEFDKKNRNPHYEIEIISDSEKVEIEVDAVSSKAVIKEREALKDRDKAELNALKNAKISQDEAVKIAQARFTGELYEISIDEENNRFVYEVELHSSTEKAEFDIDVETGAILKMKTKSINKSASGKGNAGAANGNGNSNANINSGQKDPQLIITLDQAIEIALSKASGTVEKAELDGMKYEIEIRNGKMEYEFEIHAKTGAILSYEEDLED